MSKISPAKSLSVSYLCQTCVILSYNSSVQLLIVSQHIQVPDSDHQQLKDASERLEVFHHNAITVQKAVQPVQNFFLANTQKKVTEFSITVKKFQEKFETCGPGTVGDDLEKGVVLLKVRLVYF